MKYSRFVFNNNHNVEMVTIILHYRNQYHFSRNVIHYYSELNFRQLALIFHYYYSMNAYRMTLRKMLKSENYQQ